MNILVNCLDLLSVEIFELENSVGFEGCWIYHKLKLYLKESRTDKLPRSRVKSVAGILRTNESTLLATLDQLPSTLAASKGQYWQLHEITKELKTLNLRVNSLVNSRVNKGMGMGKGMGKGKGKDQGNIDPNKLDPKPTPQQPKEAPPDNSPDAPKNLKRKKDPLIEVVPNVWITDHEQDKLIKKFGSSEEAKYQALCLSKYSLQNPSRFAKYKDHYLTILDFREREISKGRQYINHPALGWCYQPNYVVEKLQGAR